MLIFFITSAHGNTVHRMYTTDDGLPSGFIKHTSQLPSGHLAISTDGGLAFFDGYDFHIKTVTNGLPDNFIKQTIIDSDNRLLIATDQGPAYAELTEDRIPLSFQPLNFKTVDGDPRIRWMYQASDENIYLSGQNYIYMLDREDDIHLLPFTFSTRHQTDFVRSFTFLEDAAGGLLIPSTDNNLLYKPPGQHSIDQVPDTGLPDQLREIIHLHNNRYLIGSNNGLYVVVWDAESQKVCHQKFIDESRGIDVDNISRQEHHLFLIGSSGDGLYQLDLEEMTIGKTREFFSDFIKHVLPDHNGNQWISTDHGLVLIPNMPFGNIGLEAGLPRRYVSGVLRDLQNILWIATHEGIFYREPGTMSLKKLEYLDQSYIKNIRYRPDEHLLYVFSTNEIHIVDTITRTGRQLAAFSAVMDIENTAITNDGKIWLVDYYGTLQLFNIRTGELTLIASDHGVNQQVNGIAIAPDGTVWISGPSRFLSRMEPGSKIFKPVDWNVFSEEPSKQTRLSYLLHGKNGKLWIGGSNGLYVMETRETDLESRFYQAFESGPVQWIEKHDHRIWFGSNRYLYLLKYDDSDSGHSFRRFSTANGLTSTSFNYDASFIDHHGYLWMGTNVGVSYYNGGDILMESLPVRLRYWQAGDREFDTTHKQLLDHGYNRFTFTFTTLDYPADDIAFQTRMLGVDEDWSAPGSSPEFTQYLFGSGRYTFEVRASRNSNIWTDPLEISFVIMPPWWRSNIMLLIYLLLMIVSIIGFANWRSATLVRRNKELADKVRSHTRHLTDTVRKLENEIRERRQVEYQLKESNQTKDRIIRILSHDLRSPFQGIIGFASMLRDQYDDFSDKERREMVDQVVSSTRKAVELFNHLLDWLNIKRGKTDYEPELIPVRKPVDKVIDLLKSLADSKSICITINVPDQLTVYADQHMLQSILQNLTSNAIKFTPDGGTVSLSASGKNNVTVIRLEDNGVGMKQDKLEKILSKQEVGSTRGTRKERGSGLGLMMCKEMLDLQGGSLAGTSTEGKGTAFEITLPQTAKTE